MKFLCFLLRISICLYLVEIIYTKQCPHIRENEQITKSHIIPDKKTEIKPHTQPQHSQSWDCKLIDACSDIEGFSAILALHQQLDDDANGKVDIAESDEFLRDELHYENGYERQKGFHGNDKHISVDELWQSWKNSQVHNWTVEETLGWLEAWVELPQYGPVFLQHQVDGAKLPRLATHKDNFLSQVLGIKDPIHKHKISVKSMDVVLFGPPKSHNYVKDAALVFAVVMALGGLWFALMQHRYAQRHLHKMMADLESLHNAEESLRQLQCKLDQARLEQELVVTEKRNLEKRLQDEIATIKQREISFSDLSSLARAQQLEAELGAVQEELRRTERALEARSWTPPPQLQHWLQLTHEMELRNYNAKRLRAEHQLQLAKEGCEKLNKRRSTFLGTFKVAHGNSINDIDNRILQARAALAELTGDLQERTLRWKQIEQLCGFPIVHNPGMLFLETLVRRTAAAPMAPGVTPPRAVDSYSKMCLPPSSAAAALSRSGSEGTIMATSPGLLVQQPPAAATYVAASLAPQSSAESSDPGLRSMDDPLLDPPRPTFYLGDPSSQANGFHEIVPSLSASEPALDSLLVSRKKKPGHVEESSPGKGRKKRTITLFRKKVN